jgi:hypothetical protein
LQAKPASAGYCQRERASARFLFLSALIRQVHTQWRQVRGPTREFRRRRFKVGLS